MVVKEKVKVWLWRKTYEVVYSNLNKQAAEIRDCLTALIEFIEVIRRRRYDNPKEDDNTYI